MPPDTVFLVDDDAAVRNGLGFQLRTAGYDVEAFSSAADFLEAYAPERRGCLLLDIQMPSITGLDLQQELNRRGWSIPVIFLTGHATIQIAIDATKAGAFNLIEKPIREDVLLGCIRSAFDENEAARLERLVRAQIHARAALLSPRERQVLALVAAGEPNKLIARELGISFRTVEAHRANIIQKLQARSPADLVRLASLVHSVRLRRSS